jgi:uncharacterized protein (TIGR00730 family)
VFDIVAGEFPLRVAEFVEPRFKPIPPTAMLNVTPVGGHASPESIQSTASPYEMKASDKTPQGLIPTTKAFDNHAFLASRDARILRILCEFQEPQLRLKRNGVKGTILFFGSARSMRQVDYDLTMANLTKDREAAESEAARAAVQTKVDRFHKVAWMCQWADVAEELSRKLTMWAMADTDVKDELLEQPDYLTGAVEEGQRHGKQPLVVLTGGGPGIMEAANRGAASVPGAKSMGMGISLPFEKGLNPYVTPDLAFEFHYFFTRKFWMMYSAKALVVGPGGFGTMDELFELMTLRQTGKLPKDIPIVLLGSHYWRTVVNWQAMADFGTISQDEVDRLVFADDCETAYTHIISTLEKIAARHQVNVALTPQKKAASPVEMPPAMKLAGSSPLSS